MTTHASDRNIPLVRSVFSHHIESSPDSLVRVRHFDASDLLVSTSVVRRHVLNEWEAEVALSRARSRNDGLVFQGIF